MKTILYNPIFINPQAYYVFPRLTRYLQPDNESTAEPANYIGTIEVKVIAYGDTTLKRTYTNTDSIDLSEFKNTWIRISLFTKVGSCVLGEWKIGNMESDLPYIDPEVLASLKAVVIVGNKTNNDSDRAIVKNLVDPDNPFVISNAAYTEGSGYADKGSPYYGAFVTDGIDDLITSTKTVQEMLGGSNELTIVSMIHQVKDSANNVSFTNYIRGSANGYFRNIVNNYGKTGIYGYTSSDLMGLSVVNNILGDKNDYTSNGDNRDSIINGNFSVQGYSYNDGNNTGDFSSVAWYWTIIANKVLTTDQINQVIAYFNLDRTLNPDILCNTIKQGITNENHAEFGDKLIDFSGNGRDIQLNNIAWKGDSGIGKYEVDFLDSSIWNSSNSTITSSKIDCKNAITHIMLLYYSVGSKEYPDIPSFKVIKTGADIDYSYIDETGAPKSVKIVDGVNILPASHNTLYSGSGRFCGFGNPGMGNSVTITQIPSHAGGLCLDGINDFGKVTGMPVYKDYTFIIDRQIISIGDTAGIVASKSEDSTDVNKQGAFLFEYLGGPNNVSAWSFYKDNGKVANTDFTRGISYQSKYSYNGVELLAGTALDSDKLWLGTLRDKDSRFANVAIYSLMSFPYSMSKFLIERQLKKYKLGTLYPNMVEFRPVINSNVLLDSKPTFVIRGTNTYLNAGDYVPENSQIWISIKMNNAADRITKFTVNGKTIDIPENAYSEVTLQYGFPFVIDKSPQKIGITIEQDENYVLFNPVINSNYDNYKLTFHLREYEKLINIGDYIPKGTYIRAYLYLKNDIDELVTFTFNGVNIDYAKSPVLDSAYNVRQIYNYDSPQEVNITIDEYIRYEDIVQPYPVIFQIKDRNTNQRYSWGDKIKVGSSIRLSQGEKPNLLSGLYSIQSYEYEGKMYSYNQLTNLNIILTKQSISLSCNKTWLLDDNEPKCILSPRLLRIPNSSYKILGYIPDISGHGNHGKINNSAYAEGSGVNEDGSYQFDGVDDFVTIPTVTGGKQVLMKVNWQSIAGTAILYDQRTNGGFAIFNRDYDTNENKVPAYRARNIGGNTYIDGILNEYIYASQLQNITHNIVELYDPELNIGTLNPKIGSSYLNSNYAQMSLYDFMLFDNISTDDKIKELNEYVGIEAKVELPPYYWDAYGKTNLDEDKATIQQRGVAVGDYDLTNYNHAYDKMSGYGGYSLGRFDKSWASSSSNNTSVIVVSRNPYDITLKKLGGNSDWEFNNTELKVISNPVSVKFKSNKNIRVTCDYHYYPVGGNSEGTPLGITSKDLIANKDAIITISPISQENIDKYNIDVNRGYYLIYFQLSSTLAVNEEVTIEMLPLYPNGLVYDGVTDYSENTNIPALTDYTYILKRQILKGIANSAVMYKGNITVNQGGAFICNYCEPSDTNLFTDFSFGGLLRSNDIDKPIIYGTKTSVNGDSITPGENIDTVGINVGKWVNYLPMVFYKLILYPKTIPLLQINFLKNLMERDEIIDLNNKIFIQE